jgi:phenylacetyl-CoA:acceptor oxidoreductase subunit 2
MSYGPNPWQQKHWDWRAAANFMLGGTGGGLLVASAMAVPSPRPAILLALLLIAGGLGAVWLEIGRKLRAIHVFFNPRTSWMTRESFAALVLFALGICALLLPQAWLTHACAVVALAFVYCQARILRASKGIPAWRAPEGVPLILASALAEGAGAALLFETAPVALFFLGLTLIARLIAWYRFRAALRRESRSAALEDAGRILVLLGTIVPLALLPAAYAAPQVAPLAAFAALATGWWFKYTLVTRAALNQGFALPHLPARGGRQEAAQR